MKLFAMAMTALSFLTKGTEALNITAAPVAVYPNFLTVTSSNDTYIAHQNISKDLDDALATFAAVMAIGVTANLVSTSTRKTSEKAVEVQPSTLVTPQNQAVVVPAVVVPALTMNEQAIEQANRKMLVVAQTMAKAEAARAESKARGYRGGEIREGAAHNYLRA